MDGGRVLKKGSLLVNHPITFRGITFYQSSYGTIPGERVRLKISRHQEEPKTLEIERGHPVPLPHNEGQLEVMEVHGNLKGMMGPAALISIKPKQGEEVRFWVFQDFKSLQKRFPKSMFQSAILNPSAFKPYTFYLNEIQSKYYTGLQVNKDPGVPLVWMGFFLIVMGLFITFFTSHRRVWVRVSKDKSKIRISVTGKANKNPVGMEREIDHFAHKLKNLFTTER
jgi:cytochrome c biogenesis protein